MLISRWMASRGIGSEHALLLVVMLFDHKVYLFEEHHPLPEVWDPIVKLYALILEELLVCPAIQELFLALRKLLLVQGFEVRDDLLIKLPKRDASGLEPFV